MREIALYRTWIAEALARSGELDAAHDTLKRARKASNGVNSSRLAARLTEAGRTLSDV